MEESEIDAEAKKEEDFQNKSQNLGDDAKGSSDITNVVLTKQLNELDEPHSGDASDFVTKNDGKEEDNFNHTFECQVDEGAECNSGVAGQQELIGEPVIANPDTGIDFHEVNLAGQFNGEVEAKPASQQKCLTNMQASIDFLEVNLFEQFNVEVEDKVSGSQQKCLTNMNDGGEEEAMEEYGVDCTEANMDAPADSLEVAGEEEAMEEYDVDCTEANVDVLADSLEVAGEEEASEEYDVDCTETNVDAPVDSLEIAGEDYAEVTAESAAHSLPPLPLIPNAAQEGECEIKVGGSQQCLHVSETNTEVAGEEPTEESEIDHVEANVDSPAHALPPPASLMPNAAPEPVFTLPELITKTPLENSSAATSIGQILVSDNKENLVCAKENKGTAGNNNKQPLENLSLRKLTKMLKDLTISKDPSGKEAASSRSALQQLPDNRLTSENKN